MSDASGSGILARVRPNAAPSRRSAKQNAHPSVFEVSFLLVRFAPPTNQWRVRRSSPSQLRDSGRFTLPSLKAPANQVVGLRSISPPAKRNRSCGLSRIARFALRIRGLRICRRFQLNNRCDRYSFTRFNVATLARAWELAKPTLWRAWLPGSASLAHSASIWKLTDVFTSIAIGRPSLRAGSNRHWFTAVRADSSKLGVPLEVRILSDSTRPSTPMRSRRVTFP